MQPKSIIIYLSVLMHYTCNSGKEKVNVEVKEFTYSSYTLILPNQILIHKYLKIDPDGKCLVMSKTDSESIPIYFKSKIEDNLIKAINDAFSLQNQNKIFDYRETTDTTILYHGPIGCITFKNVTGEHYLLFIQSQLPKELNHLVMKLDSITENVKSKRIKAFDLEDYRDSLLHLNKNIGPQLKTYIEFNPPIVIHD